MKRGVMTLVFLAIVFAAVVMITQPRNITGQTVGEITSPQTQQGIELLQALPNICQKPNNPESDPSITSVSCEDSYRPYNACEIPSNEEVSVMGRPTKISELGRSGILEVFRGQRCCGTTYGEGNDCCREKSDTKEEGDIRIIDNTQDLKCPGPIGGANGDGFEQCFDDVPPSQYACCYEGEKSQNANKGNAGGNGKSNDYSYYPIGEAICCPGSTTVEGSILYAKGPGAQLDCSQITNPEFDDSGEDSRHKGILDQDLNKNIAYDKTEYHKCHSSYSDYTRLVPRCYPAETQCSQYSPSNDITVQDEPNDDGCCAYGGEAGGKSDAIENFLKKLDETPGCSAIITSTNTGCHNIDSDHYKGCAIDIKLDPSACNVKLAENYVEQELAARKGEVTCIAEGTYLHCELCD